MQTLIFSIRLLGSLSLLFLTVESESVCGHESDLWTLYKDEKCFKVLESFANHAEAIQACQQEIGTKDLNVLPTINSTEEQEFLTQLVFGNSVVAENVWLDAQRGDEDSTNFSWQGGSIRLHFTNWAVGAPSSNLNKNCSQMVSSLAKNQQDSSFKDISENIINQLGSADGQWEDVSCLKRNLVVCQKRQTWSVEQLQETLLKVRQEMQAQGNKMEEQLNSLKSNPVPLGFIYVQLPNQAAPDVIWPTITWTDVTSEYAGLFFRAGGGLAAPFGSEQGESSRRISQVQYSDSTATGCPGWGPIDIPRDGGWSKWIQIGHLTEAVPGRCEASRFLSETSNENRPRNTAVQIWRRTK